MRRLSPDEAWADPRFALRRLLRRVTIDPRRFGPALPPGAAAALARRVRPAQEAALTAGGRDAPARCILLLAPTPRSGTNFVESLIAAHRGVRAAPCGLRELPLLAEADRIRPLERALGRRHRENETLIAPYETLAHLATGLLARAAAEAPEARALLLKDPHARRLDLAEAVFPGAFTVMVLRDGRRAVDSMARTWPPRFPGRTFADMCAEWALATEAALDWLEAGGAGRHALRYEDAAADPAGTAMSLWTRLGLPPDPAARLALGTLPVLGSSTHSVGAEGVDWRPRPQTPDFDPAGRSLDWSPGRERAFARHAGATQARLDRLFPIGGAGRRAAETRAAA